MPRGSSQDRTRPRGAVLALAAAWILLVGVLGGAAAFAILDWDPERPRLGLAWDFGLPPAAEDKAAADAGAVSDRAPLATRHVATLPLSPPPSSDAGTAGRTGDSAVEEPAEQAGPPAETAGAAGQEPVAEVAEQASGAVPEEAAEPDPEAQPETSALETGAEQAAPEESPEPAPSRVAPRVAIVITGLGLDGEATRAAIETLPARVSLSFSPYADDLPAWMARARGDGHEVLLDLPMEPASFPRDDPGPRALLTGLQPGQNLERLNWLLGRGEGYSGLAVYMGSRFLASSADLQPVLREIADRRLFLLDNAGGAGSQVPALAGKAGLSHATVDRVLDAGAPGPETLAARLVQAERLALANGHSVVTARVSGLVIREIVAWSAGLEARGLDLAPVGGLLQRPPEG